MILKFNDKLPVIEPSVFVALSAAVVGDVVIGGCSSIWFNAVIRADINQIRLGSYTNIQDFCMCHVPSQLPLIVGDYVTTGHHVVLHGCNIGDSCLIGMGSVIMDGAKIGEGAIIGAGSVVTEGSEIPPHVLALGTPARVKRDLSQGEREMIIKSAKKYSELAEKYIKSGYNGLTL